MRARRTEGDDRRIDSPPLGQVDQTFKKAPKSRVVGDESLPLFRTEAESS